MGGVVALQHVLLVNDPAAAEALAAELRAGEYDVAIDTHDGGWTWIVRVAEDEALTPAEAERARAWFVRVGERYGAAYEGWDERATPDA